MFLYDKRQGSKAKLFVCSSDAQEITDSNLNLMMIMMFQGLNVSQLLNITLTLPEKQNQGENDKLRVQS